MVVGGILVSITRAGGSVFEEVLVAVVVRCVRVSV